MITAGLRARNRGNRVAVLDVGSSKVACMIAHRTDTGHEVIGAGQQVSHGIRGGVVLDMELAEAAIRSAVEIAEHMARETISRMVVSLTGGLPQSRRVRFEVPLNGHEVGDLDIQRVLDSQWLRQQQTADRRLVHAIPVSYSIDDHQGVRDPRGMVGSRLGANLHLVSVEATAARNITTCVSRCHLEPETLIASGYAAGLGCLVDDEMDLGCTLLDMGAGSTGIALFYQGELVHLDAVPVGGLHVTNDIARGLSTTVAHAERIKSLFASVLRSPSDDRELINVPLVGEDDEGEAQQVPRSMLYGIVKPRIDELLELVRARIQASGLHNMAGRTVILTGGASQLTGLRELTASMLSSKVRIGRPAPVSGVPESFTGPGFSVCAGLLHYIFEKPEEPISPSFSHLSEGRGPFGRLGTWLREHF